MSQKQRRKRFIDTPVQGSLVRRVLIHWFGFAVVAGIIAFMLQLLADPFQPMGEHLRQVWWNHGPFFLAILCLLPVFIVDTIKLSHRFAGPVARLRGEMRRVAQGSPPQPLKFRKGDFWAELADDYNAMLLELTKKSADDSDAMTESDCEPTMAGRR